VSNRAATGLVANSRATLEDAERSETWLPRRRAVIYNGVDVNEYPPARPGARKALRIACVANFNPWKDQVAAVEAVALVRSAGLDVTLVLVGSGPRASAIRAAVSKHGLDEHVEFAGQVTPNAQLRRADVFLLPTVQEGFSNALLEAMAAGLPVVATDVGGNREAFTDGEGGRLVPPRDPSAIAAALLEIGADPAQMRRMGAANRARVAEHFTIQQSAERLARFYAGEDSPP
jgi:glycosyltransferase involved in cell wall biosynthesis